MENATDKEAARQLELGIISETVEVFRYKTHVYQKLSDALKYAEIDMSRNDPEPEAPATKTVT